MFRLNEYSVMTIILVMGELSMPNPHSATRSVSFEILELTTVWGFLLINPRPQNGMLLFSSDMLVLWMRTPVCRDAVYITWFPLELFWRQAVHALSLSFDLDGGSTVKVGSAWKQIWHLHDKIRVKAMHLCRQDKRKSEKGKL